MSKRVESNLEFGLHINRDGIEYSAWQDIAQYQAGEYLLQAFKRGVFQDVGNYKTPEQLETAMRNIEPDLRKWKLHRP